MKLALKSSIVVCVVAVVVCGGVVVVEGDGLVQGWGATMPLSVDRNFLLPRRSFDHGLERERGGWAGRGVPPTPSDDKLLLPCLL